MAAEIAETNHTDTLFNNLVAGMSPKHLTDVYGFHNNLNRTYISHSWMSNMKSFHAPNLIFNFRYES